MTSINPSIDAPSTEEENESAWLEDWGYAQTHTPNEILRNGIGAITESFRLGEITSEQADNYLRILISEYVATIATKQITDYLNRYLVSSQINPLLHGFQSTSTGKKGALHV